MIALIGKKMLSINIHDFGTISVLLTLARCSGKYDWGATSDQIWRERVSADVDFDSLMIVLRELKKIGVVKEEVKQTGTAGSTSTFYKLADGCELKMELSVPLSKE